MDSRSAKQKRSHATAGLPEPKWGVWIPPRVISKRLSAPEGSGALNILEKMPEITQERLRDLLIAPHEDLGLELKNWLDLRGNEDHKAVLAKAILALANHGGGFLIIGLDEANGVVSESAARPATFDSYDQDFINGIMQRYADPGFHCSVHIVANQQGAQFPIVAVPGGHRVPIRARRAGPNGNIVEANAIYIRKPGPRSEIPLGAHEWDGLLARCFANRREEMFDQIRDLITGSVREVPAVAAPVVIDQWIERSLDRWSQLVADLPPGAGPRCPNGFYWYAYELEGTVRNPSLPQLPDLLRRSVVRHTGWPPFWYPTRPGIEPYPIEDIVECWLGGDPETAIQDRDPAHSDFWRISPTGLAFLLRGYQEDGAEIQRPGSPIIEPGTQFDITLPVWRTGEALLHVASLARNLFEGPVTVTFVAHYAGLEGRQLTSMTGNRLVFGQHTSRQGSITLRTRVPAESIEANLPEVVHPLLTNLYGLFNFMELPMALVVEELARMRSGRM